MNENPSGIFVALNERGAFVRVNGRGTFQNAQVLRQFGLEAIGRGCRAIALDLSGCLSMDSTFLGVLAGFGLKLRELGREDALHLFNAGNRTLEACQTLGLDRLARLDCGPPEPASLAPPASDFHKLDCDPAPDKTRDKSATAALMLEAHEDLCTCDEGNEARFQDVKSYLREEIAKQKC
jgi:anti-anti-sigma regulatory factor